MEAVVPALAAVVVVVAGLAAAIMGTRSSPAEPEVVSNAPVDPNAPPGPVVQAPPLKAPQTNPHAAALAAGESSMAARTLGAGGTCRDCGVVEMVVAVHAYGQAQASSYQMHIRMDDGSMRTVEQRGALAPGSRVRVQGPSVRALTPQPGKG